MFFQLKRNIFLTLLFLISFLSLNQSVQATETNQIGYTVAPVIPDNQIGDTSAYFDLRVEPSQQQTIQVELQNDSTEDKTVQAQLANATTNINGLVVYEAETNEEIDYSLRKPLTEWVDLSANEITIPAGQSVMLDVTLNVPEEAFDGVKLAGLIFQEVTEEETGDPSGKQGVTVQNAFTYIIALQVSENDNEVPVDFAIGKVSPELANGSRTVVAQIQHPQARLTGGVSIQADIFEQNGDQVIASKTMEDVSFAPNSTMPFTVEWDKALKAGDYRIDMVLTRGDQEWDFTKEFTIQPEEEAEINEAAVTEVVDDSASLPTWVIIAAILVVIIIITLIAYVLHLKRKLK